jgi:hypothetical protein
MRHHAMTLLMIGALGSACAATEDGDDVACADGAACATTAAARRPSPPQRIQAGDDLVLLAVTDDDHALYQDGQTVYATHLRAGAPRTVVAEVPGTNLAFPLQVGRVVFLWTDPQRKPPRLWREPAGVVDRGRRPAPDLCPVLGRAGRHRRQPRQPRAGLHDQRHRRRRAWRSGLRPDRDREPRRPCSCATSRWAFPTAGVGPWPASAAIAAHAFPVAAYCAGDDVTATLSRWDRGVRRDLIAGIATPLPFTLEADPRGTTFLVNLADDRVATVTADGEGRDRRRRPQPDRLRHPARRRGLRRPHRGRGRAADRARRRGPARGRAGGRALRRPVQPRGLLPQPDRVARRARRAVRHDLRSRHRPDRHAPARHPHRRHPRSSPPTRPRPSAASCSPPTPTTRSTSPMSI